VRVGCVVSPAAPPVRPLRGAPRYTQTYLSRVVGLDTAALLCSELGFCSCVAYLDKCHLAWEIYDRDMVPCRTWRLVLFAEQIPRYPRSGPSPTVQVVV